MALVKLLYFASVRESVGRGEEMLDIPECFATPDALADWLTTLGAGYAAAFADRSKLRCAADQAMLAMDAPLGEPSEIAFFPPVTGG
jgi:sulfur-carrier protein